MLWMMRVGVAEVSNSALAPDIAVTSHASLIESCADIIGALVSQQFATLRCHHQAHGLQQNFKPARAQARRNAILSKAKNLFA